MFAHQTASRAWYGGIRPLSTSTTVIAGAASTVTGRTSDRWGIVPGRESPARMADMSLHVGAYLASCCLVIGGYEARSQNVSRESDVVYGRKFDLALTLEVLTPPSRDGLGVVWVVSSSGTSSREQTLQESFTLANDL